MEAVCYFETLLNLYHATWHHVVGENALQMNNVAASSFTKEKREFPLSSMNPVEHMDTFRLSVASDTLFPA
jgi:hypothetical protein